MKNLHLNLYPYLYLLQMQHAVCSSSWSARFFQTLAHSSFGKRFRPLGHSTWGGRRNSDSPLTTGPGSALSCFRMLARPGFQKSPDVPRQVPRECFT